MPHGIHERKNYEVGTHQWRGRLGGLASTSKWRRHLVKMFNQLEKDFGRDYAVMKLWRAGKRSAFDKAYKGRKRCLTNEQIQKIKKIQKLKDQKSLPQKQLDHLKCQDSI